MPYILSEHAQGTPEWKADRAGRATGSKASAILAKVKSGEAATRADYRVQLALERLLGEPCEDEFTSRDIQNGIEREPFARMAYEAKTGLFVQEAGFAYWEKLMVGCSVDGFAEQRQRKGFVEIKCPKSKTHLEYLTGNRLPPVYKPQVLHNFLITNADFADFISFDPKMPEKLQLFVFRVERDDEEIRAYEAELRQFLIEVDATHKQLALMAA
ncbi:YqaJ viral recombinase family protein [Paraburkholderia panacisoli]|uniref:YqaJ viral recombinase family protein n=1 Tax=Paraburkholderia panacisoli TaxID=2603818 RepID=A0A5B0HDT9_9BURK|nr:YqaJ viral recombinase family protein [Paraburkholderia panacisoli]